MNVVYIKHFDNGKKYVGITNNFQKRMSDHEYDAKHGSQLLVHFAMRKYSHKTEIVFESENYDEVLEMERIIIQNFKDLGIELYNMTDGGEGSLGYKHSEESKQKMRCNRPSMSGENHHMYGKHHTDETKQKISKTLKDKHKKSSMYGKHHTEETKKLLSEIRKEKYSGENHPWYGKHHTEESKKKN